MRVSFLDLRLVLLATTAIGILGARAHASVVSYTGANDGDWKAASNWSNDAVPSATTEVQFTNGNTAELSANATSAGLISTQANPGGIELDGFNLNVTGNTTNDDTFWGDITNSSPTVAKLTFGATASTASQVLDGSIGNNISLVVSGDTLTLGAANSYGNTTVHLGGTLNAAAANALGNGNQVSVDAASTLNSSANETVSSLVNKGTVNITGGLFDATGGFTNGTGTIAVGSGATLATGLATNTVNVLTLGSGGTLALGTNGTVTVSGDFNNLNAGSGSLYNPLANVTGTGIKIDAAGKGTLETISTNGSIPSTALAVGNVHVGATDTFLIENTGTSDPSLRGALTGSSGLSVPATFGAIANGGSVSIPVEVAAAGVLNGSTVTVESNFANIASQNVTLTGTAYNYANPVVQKSGSPGVLTGGGTVYTLALGPVELGSTTVETSIDILNELVGGATSAYTDALDGSFQGQTGGPFTLSGFNGFSGISGGSTTGPLDISFDPTSVGHYSELVILDPISDNGAGLGDTILNSITIDITATAVPEPGTLPILFFGLAGTWLTRRRRRR